MSRDDWAAAPYGGAMMADLRRRGTAPPTETPGDRDAYRVFAAALFGKPAGDVQRHERYQAKILALHYGYGGQNPVGDPTPEMERIIGRLTGSGVLDADATESSE